MDNEVFEMAFKLIAKLQETQGENILAAARCIADTFEQGGILQAFGSGHSYAGAIELCGRAGGYVPSKVIKKIEILKEDVVFIISNSGRNPLPIEIALQAQERGAKVVALTSVSASSKLSSKHQSGKRLFEVADVVIDNQVPDGDASIHLEGLDTAICGMSSIVTAVALQAVVLESAKMLVEKGITPPFFKSQNIDGGEEYNEALLTKYFDRIYHM